MKPITKTVEETIGWEAVDGTRFRDMEECRKYEQSAVCVAGKAVKKLTIRAVYADPAFGVYCACCDDEVLVFDIKTADDLNCINTFLKLQSGENDIIDPKYIGSKVAFRYYGGEDFGMFHGTRAEMESEFSTLMDKLFKDGEDNAQ